MNELFICQCHNTEHQLIFSYEPDWDIVTCDVHLIPEPNIFKRIWTAIKYIFGHRSNYGYFDEFIFKKEDAYKLQNIVNQLKLIKE